MVHQGHPDKALSDVKVRNAGPGKYADGNGLYLFVTDTGARRWVLRTVIHGKRCEIGLGSARLVSLKAAREDAVMLRGLARKGGDPLAQLRQARQVMPTFEEVAREVHKAHAATFRSEKHAADWIISLERYAFPAFGTRQIHTIQSSDILECLIPIWNVKAETARRVKQRIKAVFDFARAKAWRTGENPVEGVTSALPRNNSKQEHFGALPYAEVPDFIGRLREANTGEIIKLAFEFMILTAARTGEILRATWDEINLETATWTIPASRMKAKIEHRVPLSPRCIEILQMAHEICGDQHYLFEGRAKGDPLSQMAFLMPMKRMGYTDATPHGFRSAFRDWAEERTTTQHSVVEAALAHTVKSKVEAAYFRSDLFEKRRRLMDTWAAYATATPSEKVVSIKGVR